MRAHADLWCHQDVGWSPIRTITEVDERIGRTRESLKYSYLVITREGRTLTERADWRVVSNLHREKGKAWAYLCGDQAGLWRAEALRRDRAELRDFFRSERGDLLRIDGGGGARLGAGDWVRRT